jgi:hypothetical protein
MSIQNLGSRLTESTKLDAVFAAKHYSFPLLQWILSSEIRSALQLDVSS